MKKIRTLTPLALDELPTEIIVEIFLFLDPVETARLKKTCTKFKAAFYSFYLMNEYCKRDNPTEETYQKRRVILDEVLFRHKLKTKIYSPQEIKKRGNSVKVDEFQNSYFFKSINTMIDIALSYGNCDGMLIEHYGELDIDRKRFRVGTVRINFNHFTLTLGLSSTDFKSICGKFVVSLKKINYEFKKFKNMSKLTHFIQFVKNSIKRFGFTGFNFHVVQRTDNNEMDWYISIDFLNRFKNSTDYVNKLNLCQ
jgi:hypothetical protein